MRVLIVLSAALAIASASVVPTAYYTQEAIPIAYKTEIEPKSSYEYQASVQTQDYNNFQSVKSVDPAHGDINTPLSAIQAEQVLTETPTIVAAAAEPVYAEGPAVIAARAQPVYTAAAPSVYISSYQPQAVYNALPAPIVAAKAIAYGATPIVEHAQYVASTPVIQPVIRPVVRTVAPLVQHIQPTFVAAPEHQVIAVKSAAPTIVAEHIATPIVEVEQRDAVAVSEGLLTVKSQYHSQDEQGRAAYGHSEPTQTHNAYQDETGAKSGSFSYVAPNGRLLTTNYIADENGYRAATNALPIHEPAIHSRRRRSVGATVALAPAAYAPYSYSTYHVDGFNPALRTAFPIHSVNSLAYPYAGHPLAYSAVPTAYSAVPTVYSAGVHALPAYRSATLTNIVHNPGHSASYRVD